MMNCMEFAQCIECLLKRKFEELELEYLHSSWFEFLFGQSLISKFWSIVKFNLSSFLELRSFFSWVNWKIMIVICFLNVIIFLHYTYRGLCTVVHMLQNTHMLWVNNSILCICSNWSWQELQIFLTYAQLQMNLSCCPLKAIYLIILWCRLIVITVTYYLY